MVLAHLRGPLRSDYPNGDNSRVRERLVLQAVAQECEAQGLLAQAQMKTSLIASVKDKARTLRDASDCLRMGTALLRMEPYDKILRQVKAHSVDANVSAFRLLERTNVFDMLRDILKKERQNGVPV